MSGYDERLLASAPAATRAEKQEGYNIDLLENNRARSTSATPPPAALSTDHSKAEAGGYAGSARNGYTSAVPAAAPKPWYKTRKWLIIMFIGAIVIIGAVVGGAVGGTAGQHKNNAAATPTVGASGGGGGEAATRTTSQSAGGGGGEPATTTSSSPASTTSNSGGGGGGGGGVGNVVTQGTVGHTQSTTTPSVANAGAGVGVM